MLDLLTQTLPRPAADDPPTAWQETVQTGLDALTMLNPRNALEAFLAIQFIALGTGALDSLRIAMEPGASAAHAHRHRGSAAALTRAMTGVNRLLTVQRTQPSPPDRDWGDTAAEQAARWQATPARPAEAASAGKPGANDEVVVKWIDEIDDKELVIAVEQERREKAGLPELPRKPGEPKVIYRYKPEDYIHQFQPDPKNFRKYPGWENMTMAERRDFFGYNYDGPLGPPDALTPASRDAMIAEMAAEERLKAEYGM
jgi:hypothetical protein